MNDDELKKRIAEISFEYWYQRALYQRIGQQHISGEVKKVRKAAVHFLQVLEEMPYGGAAINRQMQMRGPSSGPKGRLKDIKESLQSCDRIQKVSGHRGTREKHHVEITVEALVQLWSKLTGQPFIFNLDAAKDKNRSKAFVHAGPSFVHGMLGALDPPVEKGDGIDADLDDATTAAIKAADTKVLFEEVANALKKVSASRNFSSENPPNINDFTD
jgi:hypothetical protein